MNDGNLIQIIGKKRIRPHRIANRSRGTNIGRQSAAHARIDATFAKQNIPADRVSREILTVPDREINNNGNPRMRQLHQHSETLPGAGLVLLVLREVARMTSKIIKYVLIGPAFAQKAVCTHPNCRRGSYTTVDEAIACFDSHVNALAEAEADHWSMIEVNMMRKLRGVNR